MVLVGNSGKKSPLGAYTLIRANEEMLDFCSEHNIAGDIEIIPIKKVNEAYERVVNSDVRYRFVIDMNSLDPKD